LRTRCFSPDFLEDGMYSSKPLKSGLLPILDRRERSPRAASSPIRVVIVDDHAIVRKGIRAFLETEPDIEVVGEADNGTAGVTLVMKLKPDVAVMDVMMPGIDGVAATTAIRRDSPNTEVLALSSAMESTWVIGMVRDGAIGYLPKDTEVTELCRAIRAVAAGQVQLAPEAAARLMQEMRVTDTPETLSEREMDVLQLLVIGKTNKGIANSLQIGEKTVKTHMSNIIAKLGVQSRTQAALVAVQMGLIAPGAAMAAI
jgi:two-component system, NarL family, response regulator LiaR